MIERRLAGVPFSVPGDPGQEADADGLQDVTRRRHLPDDDRHLCAVPEREVGVDEVVVEGERVLGLDEVPVILGLRRRQVHGAVVVAAAPEDVVVDPHVEVVLDGLVVEVEFLGKLVGVAGALVERLEESDTVDAAARPREYVPEPGLHRCHSQGRAA